MGLRYVGLPRRLILGRWSTAILVIVLKLGEMKTYKYLRFLRFLFFLTVSLDHIGHIQGLVYGKVTKTFQKPKNREKEAWLCFSIILKNRPFDLYCPEESINEWVIGLGHLTKKYNPAAYVVRPGQFFWKKLKFLMLELVKMKMGKINTGRRRKF